MSTGTSAASRPAPAGREAQPLLPAARLEASRRKIRAPFELDPSMRFYSPQANVDALSHPRVAAWLDLIRERWTPTPVPGSRARLALLVPCTKYKPYPTSREHRSVNAGLLAAGWRPVRPSGAPPEILEHLGPDDDPELLNESPLERDGVVLDRFVVSEPLALVPYEHTMYLDGAPSPATAYDDPGLFEARGTSVSPERDDCTAEPRGDGTWSWGPNERAAYVRMHNTMSDAIGTALARLSPHYDHVVGWTSPGLTHRSFLADAAVRAGDGLASTRRGPDGDLPLRGVLDEHPGLLTVLPDDGQRGRARERLAARLESEGRARSEASVRAVFARGDGHDTPLGLPELVDELVAHLDGAAAAT
ncbi:MAG: hypothetical protein M3Y51_00025 [Actinomycetota bacterium]|nr:hypothetical protein [Actinomycetota bacterium]